MSAALLVRLIFWVWFGAAVYASHSLLPRLPGPALPALILALTALAMMLTQRVALLRDWALALPLRALVLLHLLRLAGIGFLFAHERGDLAFAFAVPVGIGDIAIAVLALPVALAPLEPDQRRRATLIWNVAGVTTTSLAVVSLFRLTGSNPAGAYALFGLPLGLWPTFLAPLLLATHVLIFLRLNAEK